jgi:hypothetical protein
MKLDAWFCMDCMAVRDLDIHARCDCCGSDSVTQASGSGMTHAKSVTPEKPLPLVFRVAGGLGGRRAIMRQTLQLVARARCRAGYAKPLPSREIHLEKLRASADTAVIGS